MCIKITRPPSPSNSILNTFNHSVIFLLGAWSSSSSICHRWAATYTFPCQNLVRGRYFQALQDPVHAVINDQLLRLERGTRKTNTPGICINVRENKTTERWSRTEILKLLPNQPSVKRIHHKRLRKGHVVDLPEVAPRGTHHGMRISLDLQALWRKVSINLRHLELNMFQFSVAVILFYAWTYGFDFKTKLKKTSFACANVICLIINSN